MSLESVHLDSELGHLRVKLAGIESIVNSFLYIANYLIKFGVLVSIGELY